MSVTAAELERALKQLRRLKARGLGESLAIMKLRTVGDSVDADRLEFADELLMRAHVTDTSKQWGRVRVDCIADYRYVDGQLSCRYDEPVKTSHPRRRQGPQ